MNRRDYDEVFWRFRRPGFDDYDEGGESPEVEDVPPRRDWNIFDPFEWLFGNNNREPEKETRSPEPPPPPLVPPAVSGVFKAGTKIGGWTAKQGWNTFGPAIRRGLENVPGWGPQLETESDESLDKMLAELEQNEARLNRRLQSVRQRLALVRTERARRTRRGPQDFPEPPDSDEIDPSML